MNKLTPYILCVDDDPINNEVVEDFLEDDYEVHFVSNGVECIHSVSQRKPDIILLDVMMPIMDGREVCVILKENDETKDIPLIVLSARSMEEDIKNMLILGANSYLTKPFRQEKLLETINDHLP